MKKIKVLWICNIMLPVFAEALGEEGSNKEGWLAGLCDTIMEREEENNIELHVAYPVKTQGDYERLTVCGKKGKLYGYRFYEDVSHAEQYEPALEERLARVIATVKPDVIHCFGTEFAHGLAVARCCEHKERLVVGMQGVCQAIAKAYMADLPEQVQNSVTFRDWLKKDSIRQQQQKFVLRGEREKELLGLVGNVLGRTDFDRYYVQRSNANAHYFSVNETLRHCFYEGKWEYDQCEPHTIFLSQGDYPLKGLHYMLLAAALLQKKYPDLKLRIAGNSLVNYRTLKDKLKLSGYGRYLRGLMREHGLEDRVCFLGSLKAEEMKAEYLRCGLHVCCSSNENSPNSLGEAMLLGVPCVAADVGGIPSLFTDGEDGILYRGYKIDGDDYNNTCSDCKPEKRHLCHVDTHSLSGEGKNGKNTELQQNANRLAQAVERMWEDKDKMLCYCENARKHARNTHDKEANYKKMMEIYARIAEEKV